MRRFQKILMLVPAENVYMGPAMQRATELARRNSAKLTLLSTVEQVPRRKAKKSKRIGLDIQTAFVEDQRSFLAELAEQYQSDDLAISTVVNVGMPLVETIRLVLRDNHDLLIVPEGVGGLGARTKHLLRKCPSPVWVIRPGEAEPMRILAAVGPDGRESGSLNRLIMDLATSLATLDDSELHVVRTWELAGEHSLRNSRHLAITREEVDALVEEARDEASEMFDSLLAHYDRPGTDLTIHLMKGAPQNVIPALTIAREIDLFVMGTVTQTGIAGILIGNTAERIIDTVDCSLLTVKPEGFITPITMDK